MNISYGLTIFHKTSVNRLIYYTFWQIMLYGKTLTEYIFLSYMLECVKILFYFKIADLLLNDCQIEKYEIFIVSWPHYHKLIVQKQGLDSITIILKGVAMVCRQGTPTIRMQDWESRILNIFYWPTAQPFHKYYYNRLGSDYTRYFKKRWEIKMFTWI